MLVAAPRIGVLAAGGSGRRIHPRSVRVPKVMLEVAGKPLLVRNIELLRDALGVRELVVVVGHLADFIRQHLGDGRDLGVTLRYVENPHVDAGLGTVLPVLEPHVREPFVLVLGDELYLGTNHDALATVAAPSTAVCAVLRTDDPEVVRKNYAIEVDDGRVTALIEKPDAPVGPW